MKKIKISELPYCESLDGLYTIATNSENKSVKIKIDDIIKKSKVENGNRNAKALQFDSYKNMRAVTDVPDGTIATVNNYHSDVIETFDRNEIVGKTLAGCVFDEDAPQEQFTLLFRWSENGYTKVISDGKGNITTELYINGDKQGETTPIYHNGELTPYSSMISSIVIGIELTSVETDEKDTSWLSLSYFENKITSVSPFVMTNGTWEPATDVMTLEASKIQLNMLTEKCRKEGRWLTLINTECDGSKETVMSSVSVLAENDKALSTDHIVVSRKGIRGVYGDEENYNVDVISSILAVPDDIFQGLTLGDVFGHRSSFCSLTELCSLKATDANGLDGGDKFPALEKFGGFIDARVDINLMGCHNLSKESIKNVVDGLHDFTKDSADGQPQTKPTVSLDMSRFAQGFIDCIKRKITAKGWAFS